MNEQGLQVKTIVAAIASQEDEARLRTILAFPEWNIHAVENLPGLNAAVKACSCCVVITDTRLSDGCGWKDVLDHLVGFRNRPQLIVADRLAGEALWAEVLNLGAYDLLITPFEPAEVQRVVTVAWEFCVREAVRTRDRALRKTHLTRSSSGAIMGFAVSA